MNNRASLDEFLSQFNRRQQWARIFTFAMSALGLFVVVGLVGMTVWGFASYDSARKGLSEKNNELEASQKKVGELETIVKSNSAGEEVVRLQGKLLETEKLVAEKEAKIIELQTQLQTNGAATPVNPQVSPQDCSECQATVGQQVKRIEELNAENLGLRERLKNCKPGRGKAVSSVPENKTVILQ